MGMARLGKIDRKTKETDITVSFNMDGKGTAKVQTGVGFFDHMLTLFSVHCFFDLEVDAKGDLEVDYHHTVEDVGLVLGDALDQALESREGIARYGYSVTPMDEALTSVAVDLSKRPYLVYNVPPSITGGSRFDTSLAKEFFRAFATRAGMNLHINVAYGENEHHIIESIFKGVGRALDMAVSFDKRVKSVRSSKGTL
jgi:imidazoleglycerol-phosphate dehydratase